MAGTEPSIPDPLEPLLSRPDRAGVLTDFDGTLAPIVSDPSAAAPLPGVVDALDRLVDRFRLVGVVSGRPVGYLIARLGERLAGRLWLSGLYGLEEVDRGRVVEVPEARHWRPVVDDVVDRAVAELGDVVEPKGLSLTLHFRTVPERGPAIRAWADEAAAASGLVVRSAKASVELHPPVPADKGTAIAGVVKGLEAVCFLGDDVGDLPAFDALDRLAESGVHVVRVGVATEEAPPEVLSRADVVVDGPGGALALLERLAG